MLQKLRFVGIEDQYALSRPMWVYHGPFIRYTIRKICCMIWSSALVLFLLLLQLEYSAMNLVNTMSDPYQFAKLQYRGMIGNANPDACICFFKQLQHVNGIFVLYIACLLTINIVCGNWTVIRVTSSQPFNHRHINESFRFGGLDRNRDSCVAEKCFNIGNNCGWYHKRAKCKLHIGSKSL